MKRALIPFAVFVILAVFLAIGLTKDPRILPSPFINKKAPEFKLPLLDKADVIFSSNSMLGKVWVLNVWASWCVSCRIEHPLWNGLITNNKINLIGLNYKDEVSDAHRWLKLYGDPYQLSISDIEGKVGIDWGVYAVPETFVIDKQGIVRFKHVGAITNQLINETILPLILKLEQVDINAAEQKS